MYIKIKLVFLIVIIYDCECIANYRARNDEYIKTYLIRVLDVLCVAVYFISTYITYYNNYTCVIYYIMFQSGG